MNALTHPTLDTYKFEQTPGYDQQAATKAIFGEDTPCIARRRKVIDETSRCVLADRAKTHGDAEDNFADIAALLNIRFQRKLKEPLTALDVASIGILIKEARKIADDHNLDHWVDGAGYNVCGGGIVLKNKEAT